jgi:hypothetical protein
MATRSMSSSTTIEGCRSRASSAGSVTGAMLDPVRRMAEAWG